MSSFSPISCSNCNYPLNGLEEDASCPECGHSSEAQRSAAALLEFAMHARARFLAVAATQLFASIACIVTSLFFANLLPGFIHTVLASRRAELFLLIGAACTWLGVRISWIWLARSASDEDAGSQALVPLAMFETGFAILAFILFYVPLLTGLFDATPAIIVSAFFVITSMLRSYAECVWLCDISHTSYVRAGPIIRALAVGSIVLSILMWATVIPPFNTRIWFPAVLSLAFACGAAATFLLSPKPRASSKRTS